MAKKKAPAVVEDVSAANIRLRCENAKCGQEFGVLGGRLEHDNMARCPACGWTKHFKSEEVTRVLSDHVDSLRKSWESVAGRPLK